MYGLNLVYERETATKKAGLILTLKAPITAAADDIYK